MKSACGASTSVWRNWIEMPISASTFATLPANCDCFIRLPSRSKYETPMTQVLPIRSSNCKGRAAVMPSRIVAQRCHAHLRQVRQADVAGMFLETLVLPEERARHRGRNHEHVEQRP